MKAKNKNNNNKYHHYKSSQLVKVGIKPGIIVGQEKLLPNGSFYQSFQGIPYALPPVDELRFKVYIRYYLLKFFEIMVCS